MADVLVGPRTPRLRLLRVVVGNAFRYLFGSALRNWLRNAGSTAPALGSMTLLLLLVGVAGMVGVVARTAAESEARDASVLHVYLSDDARADEVEGLRLKLASDPDVASLAYVSKGQALQRAQHRPGLPELANAADGNPFPASFDVQVKAVNRVSAVDAMVRSDPAVDPTVPTSYDPTAYRRFQQVMVGLGVGMGAFLVLLAFIAVTVTANSIRAAIISRRDEIGIMQLVGAPRWMVRGPFVIEGALTGGVAGVAAGVVAVLLTILAIRAGASAFAQVAPGLTLEAALVMGAALFIAGPVLGSLSSVASIRRHLEV